MSNRPTTFCLDDDFIYWIVSLYDADGQLVDADSLPTLSYRRQAELGLSTTGVNVAKLAGTTGTYQFRHNIALDNAITVASPQVHYTESCVIGGLTYINCWTATVRSVATLTNQAAIKTVTDALPNSGALTDLATAANLAIVDTVVDAVKVKTDQLVFTVANQVDSNSLTGGTSPAAVADAVWDESLSAHQTAGSTGKGLTDAAATGGDATAANQTAILAKLNTNPIEITNPLVDSSTLVLVNRDNYSANNSRLITFPVTTNYASATSVKLVFELNGTNIKTATAVVASATSITVDLNVDFGTLLTFATCSGAVCDQVATCDFALVAKYGTDEETIARGTSYIYDRANE